MTRTAAVLLSLLLVAGCASDTSSTNGRAGATPRYNLTGYSAAFKQGYADACATPRRRNAERFKTDSDYQIGWQDGSSICRSF